jgi:hypothetical protein
LQGKLLRYCPAGVFHEEILTAENAEDAGKSGGKNLTTEDTKDADKQGQPSAISRSGI